MCLAARIQKKFSSDGFCYVREGSFRMLPRLSGDARELPHRRWCEGGAFCISALLTRGARELLPPLGVNREQ